MSEIGCKNCGRRQKRDLKNEVIVNDPISVKPSYIINPQIENNNSILEWKSMSKVI